LRAWFIALEVFGSGSDFNVRKDEVSQNSETMFNDSKAADGLRYPDGTPVVPSAWSPLVPGAGTHNQYYLTEPIRWRKYRHDYHEWDAYGFNGYEGLKVSKADTLTTAQFVGRYVKIDQTG
jgi:hypothetical protein